MRAELWEYAWWPPLLLFGVLKARQTPGCREDASASVAEVARLPVNEPETGAVRLLTKAAPLIQAEAGTLASSATKGPTPTQALPVAEVARLPVNEQETGAVRLSTKAAPLVQAEDGTLASSATKAQALPVAEVARLPVNEPETGAIRLSTKAPPLVQAEAGTLASSATCPVTPTPAPLPPTNDARPPANALSEPIVRAALEACPDVVNLTVMAQCLGVPRRKLADFINARPELRAFVEASRQALARRANVLLASAVGEQQPWAIVFALESKGGHLYGRDDEPAETRSDSKTKRPSARPKPAAPHDDPAERDEVKRLDRNGNVAETLRAHAGQFRFAARKLGVTPRQLMDYVLLRPELQAELDDQREELLDHAETILSNQVDALRPWAIRFVLLTLGKSLGYLKPVRPRRHRARPTIAAGAAKPAAAGTASGAAQAEPALTRNI